MTNYQITIKPAHNGFVLEWNNILENGLVMQAPNLRSGTEIFTDQKALMKRVKELTS